MANINDYLEWRGDLSLRDYQFNEIDSMILARFSYLRFDKIKFNNGDTIKSISKKMSNLDNDEFLYNGDKELITNLGNSDRFNNMLITDYVNNSSKEIEKQFGAITIHLNNDEMYVSFIGTDSTINGWKEDLNMSFMENVPCQLDGKKYLEDIASKYPNKKIRIGGHSKGGNVAIYSAITVDSLIQDRIIKVDNYDGPGFNKKIVNQYGNSKIIKKIETYIPQDSVVGRILYHKEKVSISYSNEKGIYQHDIYSWQVIKDKMIKSEKNTENSENITKTINNWLETTTNEQRKIFIDSVFELFYKTESNTFKEVSSNLGSNVLKILQEYSSISKEDKRVITDMLKNMTKYYLTILKDNQTMKFENMKEHYKAELEKTFKNKD
ncbi:MAG: DUF2974 domain-containing protein [Bacilli bacterium]|nr:DUF2974 domain-containing protein [Bacilli bacterium]